MGTLEEIGSTDSMGISRDKIFWLIFLAALLLRLYLALSTVYIWDEERDWLPLATQISFNPESFYLPLRGDYHPAFAAYFIKLGSILFGENPFGFRFFSLIGGLFTIYIVFRLTFEMTSNIVAARWAAFLLAFNEYHIATSIFALEKSLHLLFACLSIAAFAWFLKKERPIFLYLAAVFTAFSFLCKEIAILLPAVYFIVLLFPKYRVWFGKWQSYFAGLIFVALIAPDIYVNLWSYDSGGAVNLFERFSQFDLGISLQPFVFYFRGAILRINKLLGGNFFDPVNYFPTMNWVMGSLLFCTVVIATFRRHRHTHFLTLLKCLFWLVFLFFLLMPSNNPSRAEVGTAAFFWVNLTLLPAVILVGIEFSRLSVRSLIPIYGMVAVATLWAVRGVLFLQLGMPVISVAYSPEFLIPADGRMVEVLAKFNSCMVCDKNPSIELIGISVFDGDKNLSEHRDSDSADIAGASLGSDDRVFWLRASKSAQPRHYTIFYRVTYASGRVYVLDGSPYGATGVFARDHPNFFERSPFWVKP